MKTILQLLVEAIASEMCLPFETQQANTIIYIYISMDESQHGHGVSGGRLGGTGFVALCLVPCHDVSEFQLWRRSASG